MKANELMIGDWIYNKHHKKNIQITPYDFFTHSHHPSGRQYFIGEPELVSGRDLEPIPLTSEILEKIGFVKFISSQFTLPNCSAGVILTKIEGLPNANGTWLVAIINGYTDAKIAITYVHELQHALRLCGIEKEIIL